MLVRWGHIPSKTKGSHHVLLKVKHACRSLASSLNLCAQVSCEQIEKKTNKEDSKFTCEIYFSSHTLIKMMKRVEPTCIWTSHAYSSAFNSQTWRPFVPDLKEVFKLSVSNLKTRRKHAKNVLISVDTLQTWHCVIDNRRRFSHCFENY